MSYVSQNAVVTLSDVQREKIWKPMTTDYMTCDTTIYRVALKPFNNAGKANTARKVTEVDHKT